MPPESENAVNTTQHEWAWGDDGKFAIGRTPPRAGHPNVVTLRHGFPVALRSTGYPTGWVGAEATTAMLRTKWPTATANAMGAGEFEVTT